MRVRHSTECTGLSYNTTSLYQSKKDRHQQGRLFEKAVLACYKCAFPQNTEGQKYVENQCFESYLQFNVKINQSKMHSGER